MEGEIDNFVVVWMTIIISLCYCHTIGMYIPKGATRLLAILPVISLFLLLPLNLTTIHLCGLTSFFISWLANFKLLLFAYGKGPLSSKRPMPLSRFIPMACLPIKIHHHPNSQEEDTTTTTTTKENDQYPSSPQKGTHKSPLNYVTKIMLLAIFVKVYDFKEHLHPKLRLLLYCFHMYIMLEMFLAMFASLARVLVRAKLEPQFNEPYLSTSLQDFWGKRWNLMVSSILRPTVYNPVRAASAGVLSRRWAPLPAVMATFLVSGLMHELIFYYIGRQRATGEVTWFFLINGACLAAEIEVKKAAKGKFRLPAMVSRLLAAAFVVGTAFWLFFPPLMRCQPDVMACKESVALIEFLMRGRLVSPNHISCPFL